MELADLLAAADGSLYAAKRAGRDRVVRAGVLADVSDHGPDRGDPTAVVSGDMAEATAAGSPPGVLDSSPT